jgi:hypothetical protein
MEISDTVKLMWVWPLKVDIAAYWFIPQLIVKSMMTDSVRRIMPPEISRIVRQSEKAIPKILADLKITPEQAKAEIDKIDYATIERVIQHFFEKKSITRDEVAELIKNETSLTHLNTQRIKGILSSNISEKQINRITTLFLENKLKIRVLLPTLKESIKQMIN